MKNQLKKGIIFVLYLIQKVVSQNQFNQKNFKIRSFQFSLFVWTIGNIS